MKKRPLVLSIAGFDPSGGAGVLADIKTFEQNKVQGMAIITGNTIQTEDNFLKVEWIEDIFVFEQLETLLNQYQFEYIKVGLIPNLAFLSHLLNHPKIKQSKIIWDPILSTSSGFDFKHDLVELNQLLSHLFLITPNWNEVKLLSGNSEAKLGAEKLAEFTNVYLKGGHSNEKVGKDFLYAKTGKVYPFNNRAKYASEKHGSGCVFSSALTANLALDLPMIKACLKSKKYITEVLESNKGLLGYHKR
jgi:hydroxymethylpyrimidine/phosphomethylpyrimidine kinase